MVFSSTTFLFIFLPLTWIIYSVIPKSMMKPKNLILALASLFFYAFGEPVYVVILLFSVTYNYFAARLMEKKERHKKVLLVISVVLNLGILFTFKYVPWLAGVFNDIFRTSLTVSGAVTIPVGISFYTFQILSYIIDVYRGKCEVQKNYLNLFLYISFFPQLIAGPIVKYGDIAAQIENREVNFEKTSKGIRRFIVGLSKKVLISNSAALIVDAAFESASPGALLAWLGAFSYMIQLYFDFSGYSDMAIGLGQMFGFEIRENFNYPYMASSIRDFWKRWHISLTSWFREYVYFPLGGNRKGKGRTVFNRIIIFFLTGAWHGANFTFIIWGLWHGLLMLLEEAFHFEKLSEKKVLRPFFRIYTVLAVCIGFVVFRAPDVPSAFSFVASMFTPGGTSGISCLSPWNVIMLLLGVIFSFPVLRALKRIHAFENGTGEALSYAFSFVLLALSVCSLASSGFNPFIYYIF